MDTARALSRGTISTCPLPHTSVLRYTSPPALLGEEAQCPKAQQQQGRASSAPFCPQPSLIPLGWDSTHTPPPALARAQTQLEVSKPDLGDTRATPALGSQTAARHRYTGEASSSGFGPSANRGRPGRPNHELPKGAPDPAARLKALSCRKEQHQTLETASLPCLGLAARDEEAGRRWSRSAK